MIITECSMIECPTCRMDIGKFLVELQVGLFPRPEHIQFYIENPALEGKGAVCPKCQVRYSQDGQFYLRYRGWI